MRPWRRNKSSWRVLDRARLVVSGGGVGGGDAGSFRSMKVSMERRLLLPRRRRA